MSSNKENAPIDWESSGYSVLKNLDSTILSMFCEFIDNSIQSSSNDKAELLKINPHFKLTIDIFWTGKEIVIQDNAGGIDKENFQRALKPANKPINTNGLNEFGIGMKYAAVWVSNEWELKSTSYKEEIERTVVFNYNDVVNKNLKELPITTKPSKAKKHGTTIFLRDLESKHTERHQEKYNKKHLASIYRNFIRSGGEFYKEFNEDPIEIRYNGELLTFSEYDFAKVPWWKDLQIEKNENAIAIEWKWKFPWRKIEIKDQERDLAGNVKSLSKIIEVTGFIGILPDGDHKGKSGFSLFRRGRIIEGADTSRVYPSSISTDQATSFKHKRMYGEIHFRNVDVSFNKSKLSIDNVTRNEIFSVLADEIKEIHINGVTYNMLTQAEKHRVGFKIANAKNAIESRKKLMVEKNKLTLLDESINKTQKKIANTVIDDKYDKQIISSQTTASKQILDDENDIDVLIGTFLYKLHINYFSSDEIDSLYTYSTINDHEEKRINVGINMKHRLFTQYPENLEEKQFNLIVEFIKCLAKSETKAKNGMDKSSDIRHAFNLFSNTIIIS